MKTGSERARVGRAPKVSGRAGKADPNTEQLRKITKKLGNTQVKTLIGRNDHARDQIYQFILHRLQKIHSVQAREKAAMKKQRVWFDEVAHKKAGYGLPDPTRWKESAGEYKKAAQALARGNLGQAVDHLERAMEAERKALQNLPKQVPLDHTETAAIERPSAAVEVHPGEGCTPREVTEALHLAETVERESDKSHAEGLFRMRKPWWGDVGEDEDDKEGKKEGKAPGKGGKKPEGTEAEPALDREAEKQAGKEAEKDAEKDAVIEEERPEQDLRPEVEVPGDRPAPPVRRVRTTVKRP